MDLETWAAILILIGFFALKGARLWGSVALSAGRPADNDHFYTAFGLVVLLLFTTAEYRGWGALDSDRVTGVPKSVRENPGVYRSHYQSYYHRYGGK